MSSWGTAAVLPGVAAVVPARMVGRRLATRGRRLATRDRGRRTADSLAGHPPIIHRTLEGIVVLLKKHKEGLRSEQIRQTLKLDVREVPRVLKEGLVKKKLKSKGQKRATTYFANGSRA